MLRKFGLLVAVTLLLAVGTSFGASFGAASSAPISGSGGGGLIWVLAASPVIPAILLAMLVRAAGWRFAWWAIRTAGWWLIQNMWRILVNISVLDGLISLWERSGRP